MKKQNIEGPDRNPGEGDMPDSNPMYSKSVYATSARIEACKGKKYGDPCTWIDDKGKVQTGICIYDKWGWTPGELFCASKDYRTDKDGDK